MGDAKKIVRIKESDFGKISVYVGLGEETEIIVEGDKLTNPEWKDGDENPVEEIYCGQCSKLSVECKDMPEGEDVIFHVFQEGDDITGAPKASVCGKAKNGVVTSDVFRCPSMNNFTLSDEDIKLFFTTEALGYVNPKSKEITVKPIKLKNPKWKDINGNEIETCLLGETICLSVEYENINEEDTMIFTIYRSEGTNEKKYKAETENINKSITNSGNGICEVEWTYKSLESRNNLKVYFTAHIDGFPEVKSTIIDISNDCDCQSFFDKKENKYNKHGLKPQITDNTYNAHCDIMAWNQALKSGYDPRGFIIDAKNNIIKSEWKGNDINVATIYNTYFSKYNKIKKSRSYAGRVVDSNNILNKVLDKVINNGKTEYYYLVPKLRQEHHTPPAGTAGFIFFKNDKNVFYHVEFYDNTMRGTKFKRYQTEGIRKVKPIDDNALTSVAHRYYVPLDKF